MPARINNPRAADQLRREYSVMGDRLNMQLDDIVVPVAVVSDLSAGSSGVPVVRRGYSAFYQAAVAGEYTVWRLEVPPGIIGIVNSVLIQAPAASLCRCHFGDSFAVTPTNIATRQYMDGRLRELGQAPAGALSFDTQVAALAAPVLYLQARAAPGELNVVEWPFGRTQAWDFIEFASAAVNQAITGAIVWDEIAAF